MRLRTEWDKYKGERAEGQSGTEGCHGFNYTNIHVVSFFLLPTKIHERNKLSITQQPSPYIFDFFLLFGTQPKSFFWIKAINTFIFLKKAKSFTKSAVVPIGYSQTFLKHEKIAHLSWTICSCGLIHIWCFWEIFTLTGQRMQNWLLINDSAHVHGNKTTRATVWLTNVFLISSGRQWSSVIEE